MDLNDLLHDIHVLEDEMRVFERKYNMLSEAFYAAYQRGEEPPSDAWVLDWTAWASGYEVLLRFREKYRSAVAQLEAQNQSLADVIARTVRHEPVLIPA